MYIRQCLIVLLFIIIPNISMAENLIELKKNIIIDQKKLTVMQNMFFDEKEANRFWPVFREFQENLFELNLKHSELLSYYVSNHKSLSDRQAEDIIESAFAIIENRQALLREFILVLELEEILPAKKIFRYLQIEQNIAMMEQHELIRKIPLLE